jgi:hypothetical protein
MTALSADRSSSNPQDDLFGHAPFAESLANSICRRPSNNGLVLALDGPSVPDTACETVDQFLLEFEVLKTGKNLDGVGAFDD